MKLRTILVGLTGAAVGATLSELSLVKALANGSQRVIRRRGISYLVTLTPLGDEFE